MAKAAALDAKVAKLMEVVKSNERKLPVVRNRSG